MNIDLKLGKLIEHDIYIEKYVQKLINSKDIRQILQEIYDDGFEDGFNAGSDDEFKVMIKKDITKL